MTTATTTRPRSGHKREAASRPTAASGSAPTSSVTRPGVTPLDTVKGPSCPDHGKKMIKKGKATRHDPPPVLTRDRRRVIVAAVARACPGRCGQDGSDGRCAVLGLRQRRPGPAARRARTGGAQDLSGPAWIELWQQESGWSQHGRERQRCLRHRPGPRSRAQQSIPGWTGQPSGLQRSCPDQVGSALHPATYGDPCTAWSHEGADGWY